MTGVASLTPALPHLTVEAVRMEHMCHPIHTSHRCEEDR